MLQVDELEWELMPTGSSKDSSLIESLITLRTSQCVSSKEVIAHLNVNAPNKNKVSILDVYVYAQTSASTPALYMSAVPCMICKPMPSSGPCWCSMH